MLDSRKAPTKEALNTQYDSIIARSDAPINEAEIDSQLDSKISELEATVIKNRKKLIHADDLSSKPAPIKWLIRKWLQSEALMMLHGDPGSGKSFLAFDWCLSIATDKITWNGHTAKTAPVVYLAGEGLAGISGRIAAWKNHHSINQTRLHIYDDPFQLDGDQASFDEFREELKEMPEPPALIVIDTVNRFMAGEENSARDTSSFIKKCQELIHEFKCSVLLVHHTGHDQDKKGRARGSSAWKAAMDVEFSLKVKKAAPEKTVFSLVQTKSKDSAPARPKTLATLQVVIPGWFEEGEEGQQEAVTSRVVMPTEEDATEQENQQLTPTEEAAIESYKEAAEAEGILSFDGELGVFRGVDLETWRTYFYKSSTADNPESKKKSFQRIRESLTNKKGRLTVSDDVYMLSHSEDQQYCRALGQILREKNQRDNRDISGTFQSLEGEEKSEK